jgi:riboflavin biosynthesis pyrimidine reductase
VRLIFPGADPAPLDDDTLAALYAPADPGRPALRANFVSSLDGAVTVDGYSEGLSGPADKRVFGVLRSVCDALMVAAGTLRHEGYGPVRVRRPDGPPPLVVVSRSLDLDPGLPALAEAPVRPYVVTCAAAPPSARKALSGVAEVLVHGDTDVDLAAAVADLHGRGLRQVLCEGGPHLVGSLIAADLVDELCLTLSPLLVGAGPGRMSAGPPTPMPRRLRLRHVLADDDALFLRYVHS